MSLFARIHLDMGVISERSVHSESINLPNDTLLSTYATWSVCTHGGAVDVALHNKVFAVVFMGRKEGCMQICIPAARLRFYFAQHLYNTRYLFYATACSGVYKRILIQHWITF